MTKIKKILGFLLANLMLFAVMPIGVFASDGTAVQPSLYAFYGDGMLFQQKQEAILNEVYELEVCFEGDENENAVIDVDAFEFTHKAEQHSSFIANIPMRIHDFVSLVYELILKFFQKIVTPIGC